MLVERVCLTHDQCLPTSLPHIIRTGVCGHALLCHEYNRIPSLFSTTAPSFSLPVQYATGSSQYSMQQDLPSTICNRIFPVQYATGSSQYSMQQDLPSTVCNRILDYTVTSKYTHTRETANGCRQQTPTDNRYCSTYVLLPLHTWTIRVHK